MFTLSYGHTNNTFIFILIPCYAFQYLNNNTTFVKMYHHVSILAVLSLVFKVNGTIDVDSFTGKTYAIIG